MSHQPDAHRDPGPGEAAPWRPTGRQVVAGVILVLVLVFALVNLEDTTIDFVADQVTIPVFFVIAGPAVLGFLAGLIVQRRRGRRRS